MAHGSGKPEAGKHGQFRHLSAQELQDLRAEMCEAAQEEATRARQPEEDMLGVAVRGKRSATSMPRASLIW